MSANDGGPISPNMEIYPAGETAGIMVAKGGLSLRDWFAGMALQGEIASPKSSVFEADSITFTEIAEDCYRIADAMLSARERKEDA